MTTHTFFVYATTPEEAQLAATMLNPDQDAVDVSEEYVDGYAEECKDQEVSVYVKHLVFEHFIMDDGDPNVRKFVAKPEDSIEPLCDLTSSELPKDNHVSLDNSDLT